MITVGNPSSSVRPNRLPILANSPQSNQLHPLLPSAWPRPGWMSKTGWSWFGPVAGVDTSEPLAGRVQSKTFISDTFFSPFSFYPVSVKRSRWRKDTESNFSFFLSLHFFSKALWHKLNLSPKLSIKRPSSLLGSFHPGQWIPIILSEHSTPPVGSNHLAPYRLLPCFAFPFLRPTSNLLFFSLSPDFFPFLHWLTPKGNLPSCTAWSRLALRSVKSKYYELFTAAFVFSFAEAATCEMHSTSVTYV